MTNKEAIEIIECELSWDYWKDDFPSDNVIEAKEIAIQALDRQIPKKPKNLNKKY